MCFIFHKWSKWEQYTWSGTCYGSRLLGTTEGKPMSERRQRRTCDECGKEQDELVRNG